MQSAVAARAFVASRPVSCKASSLRSLRAARLVVRAQKAQNEAVEAPAAEPVVPTPAPAAPAAAAVAAEPFSLFSPVQEAINGRAAMLGFLVAIASELATNQSVWSQIAGKYVDRDLVEQPHGASILFFAFIVVAVTFATFAPKVLANQGPSDRSFGPFTPSAELTNGRVAQVGFAALLLVELFKQAPLF